MNLARVSLLITASALLCHVGFAGGPQNQTSNNSASVRILAELTQSGDFGNLIGTGTIIANRDIGGEGWYCVLTADHVVSSTGRNGADSRAGVGIAEGSSPATNGGGSGLLATRIYRNPNRNDLAVLGVKYGTYNAANDSKVASLWGGSATVTSFTGEGFGARARDVPTLNHWVQDLFFGTQRRWNIGRFTISERAQATFGGYIDQTIDWNPIGVSSEGAIPGQGTAMKYDSGGAYFTTDSVSQRIDDRDVNFFTRGIFGVQSFGTFYQNGTAAQYTSRWGGVYLNAENRRWIRDQCALVSEPISLSVLGLGALVLVRRRKR